MVEVVRISREERSMPFTNHVVVEITHAGPVRASGASNLGEDVAYYAPPLFHSVRAALVAASAWAAEHGIHAIHLYADDSQLLDDCASLEVLSEEAQAKVVDQAQTREEAPERVRQTGSRARAQSDAAKRGFDRNEPIAQRLRMSRKV